MKISHDKTVLELDDTDRELLSEALFVAYCFCDDAARGRTPDIGLLRDMPSGERTPEHLRRVRDFVEVLSDKL